MQPGRTAFKAQFTLHHFADASQIAYGVVSYLRVEEEDRVSTTLLMAKSRLARLKEMTIPRLELSAATLATRQDELIQKEVDIDLESSHLWTDSTIVLQYIRNDDRRFHVFVANRVAEIRDAHNCGRRHHQQPAVDSSVG